MTRGVRLPITLVLFGLLFTWQVAHADTMSATTNDVEPIVPTQTTAGATTLSPDCIKLFGLDTGTAAWDTKYLTPELCKADQDLIARYTPGGCSSQGLSNPKVQGIIKLNPSFAIELDNMLSQPALKSLTIVSAFRSTGAQSCANPGVSNSSHQYGCAVDLGYDQNSCNSTQCQFVRANASKFGLQMRLQYAPEWNHIESANLSQCKTGYVGTPVVGPAGTGGTVTQTPVGPKTLSGNPSISLGNVAGNTTTTYVSCTINGIQTTCPVTITSPFTNTNNGLFGSSNSMLPLTLGMQAGQGLGSLLGNMFQSNPAPAPTQPTPAPLPPIPPPTPLPTPTTPTSSTTLDQLLAALNNPASSSSAVSSSTSATSSGSGVGQFTQPTSAQTGTLFAAPMQGSAPLTVVFSGSASGTSYTIDFGDGSDPAVGQIQISCSPSVPDCASGATTPVDQTHTYQTPGTYIATLADSSGNIAGTATITVENATAGMPGAPTTAVSSTTGGSTQSPFANYWAQIVAAFENAFSFILGGGASATYAPAGTTTSATSTQ